MRTKLTLLFLSMAMILPIVGYYAISISEAALQESIGEQSIVQARDMLARVNESVYVRIEQVRAYAEVLAEDTALIRSNRAFEDLNDIQGRIDEMDRAWQAAEDDQITPFMIGLINSPLSEAIRCEMEQREFYLRTRGHEVFSEVFVTNKYGANAAQTQKTSDYYQADEKWWQEARKNGLYVADIQYDRSAKVYSTDICVRVEDKEGGFLGVLKAVVNLEEVIHCLRTEDEVGTADFKLLTADNRVIYATEDFPVLEPLPEALSFDLRQRDTPGHGDYFIAEGDMPGEDEELYAFSRSSGFRDFAGLGWVLLVEHDRKDVLAPVATLRHRTLSVLLAATVLAVVWGLFISKSVCNPLRRLTEAAVRIGEGDLSTRVETRSRDEVGMLTHAFNSMATNLRTSRDELEREVADRKKAEDIAATRAVKLEQHTIELEKSRRAALGMMEDAERARRAAEAAQEELRLSNMKMVDALEREKRAAMELEAAMQQFEAAKRDAESANHSKSEFLANMSHEIRTPMTAILGFTETMLDPDLSDSEMLNAVHTVRRNGEHLLQIINDILDISKIEAGKVEVERIRFSPVQMVADVRSLMQVRADEKNLPFHIEYIGAIPETIESDHRRLKQILVNLIGNAVKFTESGSIRLVTRFVDNGVEPKMQFDVLDTGLGMTKEQVGRLFQAFSQADTSTTRKFGGTGLGLMISKRLAEILGGDITVESKPGEGSLFRVTVTTGPLDGVKMLHDPAKSTFVHPETATATKLVADKLDCRILLAEDNATNRVLVTGILKKAGAEVTEVENGKLAVDAALAALNRRRKDDPEHPFDVILMDMQMPVMDGYEATGLLRQKGYTKPIIALTAHAMAGDEQKCIDAGCDDYTPKPIDRKVMIETIRKHLPDNTSAKTEPPEPVEAMTAVTPASDDLT